MCLVTQSCLTHCDPMDCIPADSSVHGDSPGKNIGVGCRALLQGTFPTQELNQGLLHCRFFPGELPRKPFISVISLVTQLCLTLHGLQHTRLPCLSPTPGACSNSCPLSRWCHPTISSSVIPFSSCLQSFPASGSFQVSQLFASDGQSVGVSASVLPMNIQG